MNNLERFIYKLKLRWYRIKHKNNYPYLMYPKSFHKPGIINYIRHKYYLKKKRIKERNNLKEIK